MLKIAFLFLTMTNVFHENYWQDFFKDHQEQCSVHVHSKYGVDEHCWFKQFELPYRVPNSWAWTMKAQVALLKEALADPFNEMFIFCSQNCIPLQSFDFIYDELIASRKSTFRYEPNPHADPDSGLYQEYRDIKPIPRRKQYKNAQWIILNRKHAQMMVDDTRFFDVICRYPIDNEHYPSTFLAMHNQLDEVHKCEKTMVIWHLDERPPHIFTDLSDKQELQLLLDAIAYGVFFVRKIDEACDISPLDKWLDYRTGSSSIGSK